MEYTEVELRLLSDGRGYIQIPVDSSFVEQLAYDMWEHTCVVTINGTDVIYYDVSFEDFHRFVNAKETCGSVGSWYNRYVKGRW